MNMFKQLEGGETCSGQVCLEESGFKEGGCVSTESVAVMDDLERNSGERELSAENRHVTETVVLQASRGSQVWEKVAGVGVAVNLAQGFAIGDGSHSPPGSSSDCKKSVEECLKHGLKVCDNLFTHAASLCTTVGALRLKKSELIAGLDVPIYDETKLIEVVNEVDEIDRRIAEIRKMQDSAQLVIDLVYLVREANLGHEDLHICSNIVAIFTHPRTAANMGELGEEMKYMGGLEFLDYLRTSPKGVQLYAVLMEKVKELRLLDQHFP